MQILSIIFGDFLKRITPIQERNNLIHIQAAINWLCLAQDKNSDGGVPIRYALKKQAKWHPSGWNLSYPETTGYIIPTFMIYSQWTENFSIKERALRMADWLLTVQEADGSIRGGDVGSKFGSIVFDVGQVIFGFLNAYRETNDKKYINAAIMSGDWLVDIQNNDGSWVKFSFNSIPHAYHSRVSWALLELYKIYPQKKYRDAAERNIQWVLSKQRPNGWFDEAGFSVRQHLAPLTHTIAYTIRGVLESGMILNNDQCITAAQKSAEALINILKPNGMFTGNYNSEWINTSRYSCLTGNAQISIILLKLYKISTNLIYLEKAKAINSYLKSLQRINSKHEEINGAIAGSSPLWGGYEGFAFPNWATKFFIDALMLEEACTAASQFYGKSVAIG